MSSDKAKRSALSPPHCEVCQYFIQRHRIRPGREKGNYRLGNVISVCPNHHQLADNDLLPREYLWDIVRKRLDVDFLEGKLTEEVYNGAVTFITENYLNGKLESTTPAGTVEST